ncbi:MAG: Asp-tRNA(Asn)/Glu-tRNA(Gln) amidotransferase subunit GatA [Dehalococcoidia bacterium]
MLDSRKISSKELTNIFLERIQKVDKSTNAYITVTTEFALQQADIADEKIRIGEQKPLTGIPMQLKDNMSTAGIKTTCASKMLENYIPSYNCTVADRLFSEGAILLGKGNLDEFAMGSSTENSYYASTANPWDLKRVPGGSSGGPAAAVSADECLFSLGSDTGGSIRQPAAFCGVVGMKPTYGVVSRFGLIAFASSLDQIGPITKNVQDSAIVLNAISGYDPKDSTSIKNVSQDYVSNLKSNISGMKLGVPKEYFPDGMEQGVKKSVFQAIEQFKKLGVEIKEVSLPHTDYALAVYYIIAPSEAAANLARYDGVKYGFSSKGDLEDIFDDIETTRQGGFGDEVKRRIMIGTYALSAGYYDAYYLKAQKIRTIIREEFNEVFKNVDALITPTSPTVAFKLGEVIDPLQMYLNDVFTQPANIAGLPSISIPCGISEGLPVGVQLMASPMNDGVVLNLANAFEQSTDWHDLKPEISI